MASTAIVVSICYLRLFFHRPLINCVHSAVAGKREPRVSWEHMPLRSYLSTHVEAAYLRPGEFIIPGPPIRPPPPFHVIPCTNNDRNYLLRLLLHERVGRRRPTAPRKHHRTAGNRCISRWVVPSSEDRKSSVPVPVAGLLAVAGHSRGVG